MENLPITLVEAFACARLVMARVGGHSMPRGAAAEQLMELLESPVRWQQMSAVSRWRYEEKFSSEALAPRWFGPILVERAARPDGAVVAEAA